MDTWTVAAIVIVLSALLVDRTRVYRALPLLLNRLRGRSGARSQAAGVHSAQLPPVPIDRADFADREKELPQGEGH